MNKRIVRIAGVAVISCFMDTSVAYAFEIIGSKIHQIESRINASYKKQKKKFVVTKNSCKTGFSYTWCEFRWKPDENYEFTATHKDNKSVYQIDVWIPKNDASLLNFSFSTLIGILDGDKNLALAPTFQNYFLSALAKMNTDQLEDIKFIVGDYKFEIIKYSNEFNILSVKSIY